MLAALLLVGKVWPGRPQLPGAGGLLGAPTVLGPVSHRLAEHIVHGSQIHPSLGAPR